MFSRAKFDKFLRVNWSNVKRTNMTRTLSTIIGLIFAVQTWSLEIGSRVENFRLYDHQGSSHELYYYDDKKAVVFLVQGNGCPIVRNAMPRFQELAQQYRFEFPYLYDETQKVAVSFSAACTPDFFLFNKKLELFYRGRYDPSRPGSEDPVTGTDLLHAIRLLQNGDSPPEKQLPSIGCNIKWKPGQEPYYFKG